MILLPLLLFLKKTKKNTGTKLLLPKNEFDKYFFGVFWGGFAQLKIALLFENLPKYNYISLRK